MRAKLSVCLVELIKPYRNLNETRADYERLITLATLAWNVPLFPAEQQSELMQKVLSAFPKQHRQAASVLIQELVDRRNEMFPGDRRLVLGSEVIEKVGAYAVNVVSIDGAEYE